MKHIAIILFFLMFSASVCAQRFLWDGRFGGDDEDVATGISLDASENVWVSGYFADTVYFNLPSGPDSLMSAGGDEGFLMKRSSAGTLQWVGAFSGPGEVRLWSVKADGNHVVVAGTFTETMDADPGMGQMLLTSAGNRDIFIAKLTLEGQLEWVRQLVADEWDIVKKIVLDTNENILLVGSFEGALDFDPGDGVAPLTATGSTDAFVLKLDTSGNFVWVKQFASDDSASGQALVTDASGNVIVTGHFSGTIDLDPGSDTEPAVSDSGLEIFLVKLDDSGQLIWAKVFDGQNDDMVNDVNLAADGSIYATGRFASNLIFDASNPAFDLQSQGSTEAWLAHMDADGQLLWTKRIGGAGSDHGNAVVADSQGGCFVAGFFSQTMSIGNVSDGITLTAQGSNDAFVLRFDPEGNLMWKRRAGANDDDFASAITCDAADNVLVTGVFEGTVRFNPGNWDHTRVSAGEGDVFIWNMGQCQPASGSASHISCGEVLNINGESFTETGNYEQWIFTPQGCDSLVFLDLAFYPLNLTIMLEKGVFSAALGSDAYQWVDCTNGFVDIPDATDQSFTPAVPGAYAVTVFNGPCSETTECITLLQTAEMQEKMAGIVLFPNPNQGVCNVQLPLSAERVHVSITDMAGRTVWAEEKSFAGGLLTVEHRLPEGVYAFHARVGGLEQSLLMAVHE